MKKVFIIMLVIAISLISFTAFSADTTGENAIDISTQLEMYEYAPDIYDEIVGQWYCNFIAINEGYGFVLYDIEDYFTIYKIDINSDGTGKIYRYDNTELLCEVYIDAPEYISRNYSDGTIENIPYIPVNLVNHETKSVLSLILFDDEHGTVGEYYSDEYSLAIPMQSEIYVYYMKASELAESPSPIRTDATYEDFNGRWELVSANSWGRSIDYDSVDGYTTSMGMLCEIDLDSSYISINYKDATWNTWNTELLGNGTLIGYDQSTNSRSDRGDAVFSLRSDGTLLVEQRGLQMTYRKFEIDPLAEYTDESTVISVQYALNDLGYDCGTPDGAIGNNTINALSAFQSDHNLTVTGTITEETLECLRGYGFFF